MVQPWIEVHITILDGVAEYGERVVITHHCIFKGEDGLYTFAGKIFNKGIVFYVPGIIPVGELIVEANV